MTTFNYLHTTDTNSWIDAYDAESEELASVKAYDNHSNKGYLELYLISQAQADSWFKLNTRWTIKKTFLAGSKSDQYLGCFCGYIDIDSEQTLFIGIETDGYTHS